MLKNGNILAIIYPNFKIMPFLDQKYPINWPSVRLSGKICETDPRSGSSFKRNND